MDINVVPTSPRHFSPSKHAKYPHMFPLDIAVWERFLDQYGEQYNSFQYDVRCGKPCKTFPHWKENYKHCAEVLSKLRIDVVGHSDDFIDVIEVKPRLNQAALGQVLTYVDLYKKDYMPMLPVRGVIVAGEENINIDPIAENLGILIIIV